MEEWQNRLRAQKEQDRSNKNKSAQMLHSYQAKGEDEKTKQIRASRRDSQQAKKDAEQLLRSYRPTAQNIDVLTPSRANQSASNFRFDYDGALPPTVSPPSKDDPKNSIMAGSVSNIAANFTGTSTPGMMSPAGNVSPSRTDDKPTSDGATTTSATAATDQSASSNFSFTEIGSTQTTDMQQDWIQVTPDEIAIPGLDANNIQSSLGAHESEPTTNEMEIVNDQETPAPDAQQPVPGNDQMVATNPAQEENYMVQQSAPAEVPQYSRLDVDFSFGLISTRAQPSMDAYMQAVQDILLEAFEENPGMKNVLWYNSACPSFVQGIQKDESYLDSDGRGNVQRLLVKAAVPIFHTSNITPKKARSFVIKALAAALRQGYFLKIAEEA